MPGQTKQTPTSSGTQNDTANEAGRSRDTGAALRQVYQKAVDEKIPDDLLDLLGKLD